MHLERNIGIGIACQRLFEARDVRALLVGVDNALIPDSRRAMRPGLFGLPVYVHTAGLPVAFPVTLMPDSACRSRV